MLDHDLDSLDEIPGEVVKHECHNTLCCNPRHLQAGSQRGNVTEAFADDDGNGEAKFNADEVRQIRRLYAHTGRTQQEIADIFGVTVQMISGIVRREYYRWID
jgi:hypothetical protein